MMRSDQRGFTLLEMSISALLLSVLIVSLTRSARITLDALSVSQSRIHASMRLYHMHDHLKRDIAQAQQITYEKGLVPGTDSLIINPAARNEGFIASTESGVPQVVYCMIDTALVRIETGCDPFDGLPYETEQVLLRSAAGLTLLWTESATAVDYRILSVSVHREANGRRGMTQNWLLPVPRKRIVL